MRRLVLKAIDRVTGRKRGMIDYRAVSTYDYAQIQAQSRRKTVWLVLYILHRRDKDDLAAYFRRKHFSDPRYMKQKAERICRLAEKTMPDCAKLQAEIKAAERQHKRVNHLRKKLQQIKLSALRGEYGAP